MDKKVNYWIELAEYDLETAYAMLETKRYLYVGFMCHQTVEKAIKAVIVEKGIFPPKIHNLARLLDKAGLRAEMTDEQKDLIVWLNPLNIESRYPSYKDKTYQLLTMEKCQQTIKGTEEFLLWIKMLLN